MTLSQFLNIVEIRTKIVSVSGVGIGVAYAWLRYGTPEWLTLLVFVGAVLAVDMATTGFNSFFDFFSGVDSRATNTEDDKVLVHQNVSAGPALIVSLALYAVAAILGVTLAFISTPWVIPIGAVSMAVGFLYNAGPLPISRTPVGELFAGGFLGWVLVVLSVFVIAPDRVTARDMLVGIPSLLFVASILTVNNTCDIDGDRASGRHTLSIVLGRRGGEFLVYILGAAAWVSTAILVVVGVFPRVVLIGCALAAILAIPTYRAMHARGFSHQTKGPSMGAITKVFRLYTLGIVIPLVAETINGSIQLW